MKMCSNMLEIDCKNLPLLVKLKGDQGKYVLFTLKAAGRKLGAQLIKPDLTMLRLHEQN